MASFLNLDEGLVFKSKAKKTLMEGLLLQNGKSSVLG